MSDKNTTPKYMKTEDGYCYVTTPVLQTLPHLTPWDGDVDEKGFAVERAPEPAPKAKVAPKAAAKE